MPSTINSDNGVSSGTSGLKSSGGNDGILTFQSSGTETMRIDASGNVGIGTTSINKKLVVSNAGAAGVEIDPFTRSATTGGSLLAYNRSGAAYVRMDYDASEQLFFISGSEKMRLDTSGNLGLGVTPSAWSGFKVIESTAGNSVYFGSTQASLGSNAYNDGAGWKYKTTAPAGLFTNVQGVYIWYTAASGTAGNAITFTQAMTLDASGNLLVGTTSSTVGSGTGFKLVAGASGAIASRLQLGDSDSTNTGIGYSMYSTGAGAYRFYVGYGGTIYATSTTITAISDQRLKENIQDIDAGLEKIMALKPRKFDWKAGKGKDIKGDRGWIAQEFEQVFPEMIDTWEDSAPEGEEPYKAVNADLIPILVKAIQELKAELDTVKAELTALKGA